MRSGDLGLKQAFVTKIAFLAFLATGYGANYSKRRAPRVLTTTLSLCSVRQQGQLDNHLSTGGNVTSLRSNDIGRLFLVVGGLC